MDKWHRLPLWGQLFIISVALNYPWEIGQAFLYAGMDYSAASWWHCFVASLGDGLLVWMIYIAGYLVTGRTRWYAMKGSQPWAIMWVSGFGIGVLVEWVAVHKLARWAYTDAMPLMAGLNIGWVPVLQMLLLPPLIFFILTRSLRQRAE